MMETASVAGLGLEYRRISGPRPGSATIVFLHEGLGSAGLWRDFPEALCNRTGCAGLVFSRAGYGGSDPPPGPRRPDYLHREAQERLPGLLAALGIARPILFGHSDGASIALIHAASGHDVAAMILEAPHVFVEAETLAGIRAAGAAWAATDLPQRLARHHRDAARVFHDWHDVWLTAEFRDWNIEDLLPRIAAPTLVIQGADDEYGTPAQLEAIARQIGGGCETMLLDACAHTPHRERRDTVLEASARFIAQATGIAPGPGLLARP
jgi:pimeloyl-ACP methyl ester carboxylesterase